MATEIEVICARGATYPLKSSLEDLEAYQAGDVGRFVRMVDAKGAQLRTYGDAVATVRRYLADQWLWDILPAEMSAYARRAESLGIDGEGVAHG